MSIRSAQAAVWQNKLAKRFNVTDVAKEIRFLRKEVDELEEAWQLGKPDVDLELADVALFVAGLAEMLGVDLQDAVAQKLAINAAREYARGPVGELVRVDPSDRFRCICPIDPATEMVGPAVAGCPAHRARYAAQQFAERHPDERTVGERIEAGSLGTPGARALRDSVPEQVGLEIVERSKQFGGSEVDRG